MKSRAEVGGGRLLDHEEEREAGHQPDRAEVAVGVVGQLLEQSRVEDEGAVIGGEDGLAVRLGLGSGSRTDVGGTARAVLDHHRLPQLRRHRLTQDAGQRVGAAASGVGDDPFDRAFGVGGEDPSERQNRGHARRHGGSTRDAEVGHEVPPGAGSVDSGTADKRAACQGKRLGQDRSGRRYGWPEPGRGGHSISSLASSESPWCAATKAA